MVSAIGPVYAVELLDTLLCEDSDICDDPLCECGKENLSNVEKTDEKEKSEEESEEGLQEISAFNTLLDINFTGINGIASVAGIEPLQAPIAPFQSMQSLSAPIIVHDAVDNFIIRLYAFTLGRGPDAEGHSYWKNMVYGGFTGGNLAYNFLFSQEFTNKNHSNSAFIDILYLTMMGRHPDAEGKAFWLAHLNAGLPRHSVFGGFEFSPEFINLCIAAGIAQAGHPARFQRSSTISGSTNLVKVWNLIVSANFSGISNHAEHIAGIVGNMQAEAGAALCPFQQQASNQVGLGLMQWSFGRRTNLEAYMWNNGITQAEFTNEMNKHFRPDGTIGYCSNPQHVHPAAILDRALTLQINFMFHELRNTSERTYMNFINHPANKFGVAGARAYAELFCALSLRPGDGGPSGNILDEGVINARLSSGYNTGINLGRISFHNLTGRRNNAETVYRFYINNAR